MKISVIISFHGEDIYVCDCLDSLKDQTFTDFETVIVTSGVGKDKLTDDILSSYKDMDIKTIYSDKETVSAARNAGMNAAEGEYIVFLDSDDYLENSFLEKMYSMASEKECDMAFGRIEYTYYKRSIYLAEDVGKSDKEDKEDTEDNSHEHEKDGSDEEVLVYDFEIKDGDSEEVRHKKIADAAAKYLVLRRKNMTNITVLGNIYKTEFLKKNNIAFDESIEYFADMPFLANVLNADPVMYGDRQINYIKRRHNDPIHFPSHIQEVAKDDFDYRIKAYKTAVEPLEKGSYLRSQFERKLVAYYSTVVAPAIRKNEEKIWRKKRSKIMGELLADVGPLTIKETKRYRRKLIKASAAGDDAKVSKIIGRRNAFNLLVTIIKGPKRLGKIKNIIYRHRYIKMPMSDNTVLFESFFGKSYSDSPKYIFEKLNEMYPGKYNCVWILDKKTKLPYPAKQYKRFSLGYYKYLATSKYIVFNSRQPKSFIKRKGNVFLETWHGTPLKKLVFDMDEVVSASPMYKKTFYIQSRSWDYLVAANGFSDEVFKRAFDYDKNMLTYGYPRNDILHAPDKEKVADKIKDKLGIPKDKKVILYAPTWRDDEYYDSGKYKFTLKLDLPKLKKELGDEYVIILRTHYFIADSLDTTGVEDFAYNLSKYDDIAELYLISDILITDYSSVFFDYANLKRPMLFFTYDLDKYRDVLRGFYIDMEKEIPGPLLFTNDEIIDSIKNIDDVSKKYSDVYDAFYERFCGWEDGHASENCIKEVFKQ